MVPINTVRQGRAEQSLATASRPGGEAPEILGLDRYPALGECHRRGLRRLGEDEPPDHTVETDALDEARFGLAVRPKARSPRSPRPQELRPGSHHGTRRHDLIAERERGARRCARQRGRRPFRALDPREGTTPHRGPQCPRRRVRTPGSRRQQQRWDDLLDRSGLESRRLEQVRQSPAYGPLLAARRDAEAHGLDVEQTFPGLVATRPLDDAKDPAAVLRDRVDRWAQGVGSSRRASTNLIPGLIPRAVDVTDPDIARCLDERDEAMQRWARALAEQAIERSQIWVRRLGIAPTDPRARERWIEAVTTVVAYRDRWNIDDEYVPLGSKGPARTIEAINQRNLARAALDRASRLSYASGVRRPEPEAIDVGLIPTGGPSL